MGKIYAMVLIASCLSWLLVLSEKIETLMKVITGSDDITLEQQSVKLETLELTICKN